MYKGIEGVRAWLAWTVVISHVVLLSGASGVIAEKIAEAGHHAVLVFIIISGFVITHLIVTKAESFGVYLLRRVLRIYPLYIVALILGIITAPIAFATLADYPLLVPLQQHHWSAQSYEFSAHFWPHLIAHLVLIQGMIPNSVLDESQYMFVGQAWSLSLEWQFYLLAPAVVAALLNRKTRLLTVLAVMAAAAVYNKYLVDAFYNPSLILGAGLYFLLGITTRLGIEQLPSVTRYPIELVALSFSLYLFNHELLSVSVWFAVVAYLRWNGHFSLIDSNRAYMAGMRSYSVYLIHEPVMVVVLWFFIHALHASVPVILIGGTLATGLGTLLMSELLYRTIERPAIQFGRRLGQSKAQLEEIRSMP